MAFVPALVVGCAQILGIEDLPPLPEERASDAATTLDPADAQRLTNDACHPVDMIFAIDGSSTMREVIWQLSEEVFPDFITKMRELGDGKEDYRVAVLDTCPVNANFHNVRSNSEVKGGDPESCNFASGEVWMTTESPLLEAELSCVANLYLGDYNPEGTIGEDCTGNNDDEQPAATIIAALSEEFSGPGKPNEGFLRDNALLLMVAITDEDEAPPTDLPDRGTTYMEGLYEQIVAIKGDVNQIVFTTIAGTMDCRDADGYGASREARLLIHLTNLFIEQDRGVFWDMCEGNLVEGLVEAMGIIERSCSD